MLYAIKMKEIEVSIEISKPRTDNEERKWKREGDGGKDKLFADKSLGGLNAKRIKLEYINQDA